LQAAALIILIWTAFPQTHKAPLRHGKENWADTVSGDAVLPAADSTGLRLNTIPFQAILTHPIIGNGLRTDFDGLIYWRRAILILNLIPLAATLN
jgi:hypothetical protein